MFYTCLWFLNPPIVTAQESLPLLEQPPILGINGIEFGFRKQNVTFEFIGNADLTTPVVGGFLRWTNHYRGSSIPSSSVDRDDQSSSLQFEAPLASQFHGLVRGSWLLTQDSRASGLNSLQRLNGAAGLAYRPAPVFHIEGLAGIESTTQLGIEATGPIALVKAGLNDLQLDLWSVRGSALADWHQLDSRRTNLDVDVRTDVMRSIIGGSALRLGAGYTTLKREYFTTVEGGASPLTVEGRLENRFTVDADLSYAASSVVTFGVLGVLKANAISRSFQESAALVPIRAVKRTLGEFLLDLEGRIQFDWASARLQFGAAVYSRDEQNLVSPVHGITEEDLESVESQEFQRDNQTNRSSFFARGAWTPSSRDTITGEWNWWLLQYDTPSDQNDDDRDELQALATIRYSRRVSPTLTVGAQLSGQFVHLVFLKSSRSAFNNVNNVIRFSPFVVVAGSVVSMRPQLEILANYTVYDFEGQGASVRSFGFRQISYRDSIRVKLTQNLRLEAPMLVRYFERSTLLWSEFAEIPQVGNLEYLTRFLLFSNPSAQWDVGVGLRLYSTEQRTLLVGAPPAALSSVHSWAPEVNIRFATIAGSWLEIRGWYDFQTISNPIAATPSFIREVPNLLLTTRVAL